MIKEWIEAKVGLMDANGDSFSFLHANKDWQNLASDEQIFPAVYLDMPLKYNPKELQGGAIEKEWNLSVMFFYKSFLDNSPAETYNAIGKCMEAQLNFQKLINKDFDVKPESFKIGECFQVQNLFDANLDAVVMPFRIIVRTLEGAC